MYIVWYGEAFTQLRRCLSVATQRRRRGVSSPEPVQGSRAAHIVPKLRARSRRSTATAVRATVRNYSGRKDRTASSLSFPSLRPSTVVILSQLIKSNASEQILACTSKRKKWVFIYCIESFLAFFSMIVNKAKVAKAAIQCGVQASIVSQLFWQWRHSWCNPAFCWPVLCWCTLFKTMCRLRLFRVVSRDCQTYIGTVLIQCK